MQQTSSRQFVRSLAQRYAAPRMPRANSAPGASRPAPSHHTFSQGSPTQPPPANSTSHKAEPGNVKGGTSKTLWQSYTSITPRTRLVLAAGLAAFSVAGILISDRLETVLPAPPEQKEGSKFGFSLVDRSSQAKS